MQPLAPRVPVPGDVIAAKFRVERVLGVGGMGVVVAAHHMQLERLVAIKFMRDDAAQDAQAVGRFLREARAAVALTNEHVAKVLDVGTLESGAPYMVMEYLSGEDLDQLLRREGRLSVSAATDALLQACEAIAEAHSLGIVHRDLKPANLFATTRADGSRLVKVLDFGISKATTVGATAAEAAQLTSTGMVMGSPMYMSPEQVRSAKGVDARSDIWSLGVILYELLAGVAPFVGETLGDMLVKITSEAPPSLQLHRPEVPAELAAAVHQCLERRLDARIQNVAELATRLVPFAPREAALSAERILRLAGRSSGISGGSPVVSSSAHTVSPETSPARSAQPPAAPWATESPWLQSGQTETRPPSRSWIGVVLGVGLLVFGAGGVTLGYVLHKQSAPAASVSGPPPAPAVLSSSRPGGATSGSAVAPPSAASSLVAPRPAVAEGASPPPTTSAATATAAASATNRPAGGVPPRTKNAPRTGPSLVPGRLPLLQHPPERTTMTTSDNDPPRARAVAASLALFLGVPLLTCVAPATAHAQDEAAARSLFSDGRKLMKAGHYDQACSKFEAAKKLYTSSGLLLNLADCHEHLNRTASAWAEFGDAAFAASGSGRGGDEAEAKKRQAALEPKLTRIAIRVASPAKDEVVRRDGAQVDRAAWESPIPVDPGQHTVTAEAPSHTSWSATIAATEAGKTVTVEVPALVEVPQADAKASPAAGSGAVADAASAGSDGSSGQPRGKTQRTVGLVVGGAGLVAMGASGVLGLMAKSQYDTATGENGPARHTDSVNAGNLADVASVVLIAGGVVTAAGLVVWLTAPKAHTAPLAVGTSGSSVFLTGSFE